MGRVTDRYMCLGCGRFWRTDQPIIPEEARCPYCGDGFWVDNVQHDGPPAMFPEATFKCANGHTFRSDTPGDVSFCTFCSLRVDPGDPETKLFVWQEKELERLGL